MNKCVLLAVLLLTSARASAQGIVDVNDITKEQPPNRPEILKVKGKPFTGTVVGHYPNGKPELWKQVSNGLADGLRQDEFYLADVLVGVFSTFYNNGQLQ